MSDLVTAAKTLKALGDDDDGLKCVESDPPEIQRSALKKIRRAAGPAVAAFTMGILNYPRRAQGALMDALYAARSTLYAAGCRVAVLQAGIGRRKQVCRDVCHNGEIDDQPAQLHCFGGGEYNAGYVGRAESGD